MGDGRAARRRPRWGTPSGWLAFADGAGSALERQQVLATVVGAGPLGDRPGPARRRDARPPAGRAAGRRAGHPARAPRRRRPGSARGLVLGPVPALAHRRAVAARGRARPARRRARRGLRRCGGGALPPRRDRAAGPPRAGRRRSCWSSWGPRSSALVRAVDAAADISVGSMLAGGLLALLLLPAGRRGAADRAAGRLRRPRVPGPGGVGPAPARRGDRARGRAARGARAARPPPAPVVRRRRRARHTPTSEPIAAVDRGADGHARDRRPLGRRHHGRPPPGRGRRRPRPVRTGGPAAARGRRDPGRCPRAGGHRQP